MSGIANDFAAIMGVWGQTLTVVRRAVVYATSGSSTYTWNQVDQQTGRIEPYQRRASTKRTEEGIDVDTEFEVYLPAVTNVLEADRIRPQGWVTGNDEYTVTHVLNRTPSHIQLLCEVTQGHAA